MLICERQSSQGPVDGCEDVWVIPNEQLLALMHWPGQIVGADPVRISRQKGLEEPPHLLPTAPCCLLGVHPYVI